MPLTLPTQAASDCLTVLTTGTGGQHSGVAPDSHTLPVAVRVMPIQFGAPKGVSRLLVVDDDTGVREVLARMLHRMGYQVSCAVDGEAGWESLCAESFDLVITDNDMPRLTGLNLLRRIRIDRLDLPVILISGKMPWGEPDLSELLKPGIALEKPFSFVALLENVRNVLTKATAPKLIISDQIPGKFDHGGSSVVTATVGRLEFSSI